MKKVDANKDRLVTLEEFLKSTEKKEFSNPKEWEVRARRRGDEELRAAAEEVP